MPTTVVNNPNNQPISFDAWDDFTGSYDISTEDGLLNLNIAVALPMVIKKDEHDFDSYVKRAAQRFKNKEITRSRLASIMELRSILAVSPTITLRSLYAVNSDLKGHFFDLKISWSSIVNQLAKENEHFFTEVSIDINTITDNKIFDLLLLAHNLRVIYLYDHGTIEDHRFTYNQGITTVKFAIPSVSARDAFTRHRFGDDMRPLAARVGVFTMDDIERSVRNKMRYGVFSCPGVKDTTEFHEIKAPIFFMSLHDELHRQLMSSIPTKTLDAYLMAVDLIREKTGIFWSEDIWNSIDLEAGDFKDLFKEFKTEENTSKLTFYFQTLLNAKKYSTEEEFGLFSAKDSSLDTLFILMIDILENKEKWLKLGIDANCFSDYYGNVFAFVKSKEKEILNLTSAQQVAFLKHAWLQNKEKSAEISLNNCSFKVQDNYVQVLSDNKMIGDTSKAIEIALGNYNNSLDNIQTTLDRQGENIENSQVQLLQHKAVAVIDAIEREMQNKVSLQQIKQFTKIIDLTNLLLIDPTNEHLHEKYHAVVEANIPAGVLAEICSFFATLKDIVLRQNTNQDIKTTYKNNMTFFREKFSPSYVRQAREFKQIAKTCPPCLKF